METRHAWVDPATLMAVEPTATERKQPEPRASPRKTQHVPDEAVQLPARSAIERERQLPQKIEAPVRGRQKIERQTQASKTSVRDRVVQFPGHSLKESAGALFCQACKTTIFNKWSTINLHCRLENNGKPTRHATNMEKWKTRKDDDTELKTNLLEYYAAHPDEKAMTKDPDEMVFRYRTTEACLGSGIPLAKVDKVRPLLQRANFALTASQHLGVYIPKIEKAEVKLLSSEMHEQYLGIGFDGTTRLGEAINTTARWCTSGFELEQRLIDFTTMEKHLSGADLAVHISNLLIRQCNVAPQFLVNIARDSCSTNGVACRALMGNPFVNTCSMLCISHTISNAGAHLQLATLDKFKPSWLELAGGRNCHAGAKKLWAEVVSPATVPGYSKVRWWAWGSILIVIGEAGMKRLGDFITECEKRDYGDASRKALRLIYNNEPDALRLELAAMLDCRLLIAVTHELEGDRLEIMLVYDRVETLRAVGRAIKNGDDGCLPNVDATLRRTMKLKPGTVFEKYFSGHGFCTGKLVRQEKIDSTLYAGTEVNAWLVRYDSDGVEEHFEEIELRLGKDGPAPDAGDGKPKLVVRDLPERKSICDAISPAFNYLESRLSGPPLCDAQYDCSNMYEICNVIRAFDPNYADAHVNTMFIDRMHVITPIFKLGLMDGLKRELPAYLTSAAQAPDFNKSDVDAYTNNLLKWWRVNGASFPTWATAARIAFAISPNSASCERVFSLLENMYGDDQMSSLADQLRSALMLAYNKRRVG